MQLRQEPIEFELLASRLQQAVVGAVTSEDRSGWDGNRRWPGKAETGWHSSDGETAS